MTASACAIAPSTPFGASPIPPIPTRRFLTDPYVEYNPDTQQYHWYDGDRTGVEDERGRAWYYAVHAHIGPITATYFVGFSDVLLEEAIIAVEDAVERACAKLPPHLNIYYLYTLIGWRARDARWRAQQEQKREFPIDVITNNVSAKERGSTQPHFEQGYTPREESYPTGCLFTSDEYEDWFDMIPAGTLREIAVLLAAGHYKSDIAARLHVAPSMVTRSVSQIATYLQQGYAAIGIDPSANRRPLRRSAAS